MIELIIIGASGHASDVLGVVEAIDRCRSVASRRVGILVDDPTDQELERIGNGRNFTVLGGPDSLGSYDTDYVIGVGYPKARQSVQERVKEFRNRPVSLVHPAAELGTDVSIGAGSVILACASLSPKACIGSHAYISHLVGIGHHTVVEDFVSVMPGAMVSGDVVLGAGALIGTNATVLEKVHVGRGAIVGAGALVTKDVPDGVTVAGVPARPMAPK